MKKIIFIVLAFTLAGCKETETRLEKKIINTAYDDCYKKLKGILKSPSSLRIEGVVIGNYMPESKDIYRLYSDKIFDNKTNKITMLHKDSKARYRALGVGFNYEAQNTFGVYLPGDFTCSYAYELTEKNESPSDLRIFKIESSAEKADYSGASISVDSASNFRLNKNLGKVFSSTGPMFSKEDKKMLADIEKIRLDKIKNISEQRDLELIRSSGSVEKSADETIQEIDRIAAEAGF